jgi:hypothetical protein
MVALAPLDALEGLLYLVGDALIVVVAVALLVRLGRLRGAERQQTKWFAFGALPWVAVDLAWVAVNVTGGDVLALAAGLGSLVPLSGMLGAIAVAVFRYQLYDIDRLLNRTLVYGLVTAILGSGYAALVIVLGQLLGQNRSSLGIAGATLTAAGLFQPLRRRIQQAVDRRFDRRRYDAARTIERFSARLRREIDLDMLSGEAAGTGRPDDGADHGVAVAATAGWAFVPQSDGHRLSVVPLTLAPSLTPGSVPGLPVLPAEGAGGRPLADLEVVEKALPAAWLGPQELAECLRPAGVSRGDVPLGLEPAARRSRATTRRRSSSYMPQPSCASRSASGRRVIAQDLALVGGEDSPADLSQTLARMASWTVISRASRSRLKQTSPAALPPTIMSMAAVNATRSSGSRAPLRPSSGNMPTMRWPLRRAHARFPGRDRESRRPS